MTIRDIRTFTGSLRADSLFMVAPKVGGRLEKVAVHIGEAVLEKIQPLGISSADYGDQQQP